MDRLPGLFPGHSPNLRDPPAAALSRNDGSGPAWAAAFPRTVKGILQHSLRLRDRRDQNEISEPGLAPFSHHTAQAMWKPAKLEAKAVFARQGLVTDPGGRAGGFAFDLWERRSAHTAPRG